MLEDDCESDGGGLPVEVVVADTDANALPDDEKVEAAEAVTEPVLEPVAVVDEVPSELALAETD